MAHNRLTRSTTAYSAQLNQQRMNDKAKAVAAAEKRRQADIKRAQQQKAQTEKEETSFFGRQFSKLGDVLDFNKVECCVNLSGCIGVGGSVSFCPVVTQAKDGGLYFAFSGSCGASMGTYGYELAYQMSALYRWQ